MCVPQRERVPGHLVYIFKWSGSDSTDKEGGKSTVLKPVLCSFFSDSHCLLFSFWRRFNFFSLNNFLFRQQEADTEAREKDSARSGLWELPWYRPLKFKRSSYFVAGSYSCFVGAMRAARGHGNKTAEAAVWGLLNNEHCNFLFLSRVVSGVSPDRWALRWTEGSKEQRGCCWA